MVTKRLLTAAAIPIAAIVLLSAACSSGTGEAPYEKLGEGNLKVVNLLTARHTSQARASPGKAMPPRRHTGWRTDGRRLNRPRKSRCGRHRLRATSK
jgi:hypothetical protein